MKTDYRQLENVQGNLLLKIIFRVLLIFIFLGLLLFLTAGSLKYSEAWIYITVLLVPGLFVILYFYKKDPNFISRRILKRREKEPMHKSIQTIFSIVFLIALLIPGFEFPGLAYQVSKDQLLQDKGRIWLGDITLRTRITLP
jgi:hypothetical protein